MIMHDETEVMYIQVLLHVLQCLNFEIKKQLLGKQGYIFSTLILQTMLAINYLWITVICCGPVTSTCVHTV